jgi:flagellar hook-associated protein 3 FlgL
MRISSNQIYDQGLTAMLEKQSELSKTQLQVSTGRRIQSPSEDPGASVKILNLEREFSVTEQYQDNATKADNRLELEEGVLVSVTDILQRIRELAVQGLSDTNGDVQKQAIAAEMSELNNQLLSLANTRDANGDYMFSGFNANTPPYASINGSYQGDEGQRQMKIGPDVYVDTNDPGNEIFEARYISTSVTKTAGAGTANIAISSIDVSELSSPITFTYNAATNSYDVNGGPTTIPYTVADSGLTVDLNALDSSLPNVSITLTGTPSATDNFSLATTATVETMFAAIDSFIGALENNQVGPNDSPNSGDFLTNLDTLLDSVLNTQGSVGARLSSVSRQTEVNDGVSYNNQQILSELRDLDYSEAISKLSLQLTGLEAAQQTFTRVQGLSLFNFL